MSLFDTLLTEPARANYINVRDAGANGDGVSNDGPAIQAAADYLARVGGGVLFFPAGIYRCARNSQLSSPSAKEISQNYSIRIRTPNVTLEGESWDAVILQDDPWTTPVFYQITNAQGLANVMVRRLKFKGDATQLLIPVTRQTGQSTGLTGALLGIWGALPLPPLKNVTILDCLFEDGNKTSPVHLAFVDNALIQGCSFVHFKDFQMVGSVRYASTVNVDIGSSVTPTIDGTPTVGDRVLLKDQTNKAQNGVYVYLGVSGNWFKRAPDADSSAELDSLRVVVTDGSTATPSGKIFKVNKALTKLPIVLGGDGNPTSDYWVLEDNLSIPGSFKYARFATTQPLQQWPPSGTKLLIDEITTSTLVVGDIILIKDQTVAPRQNGLYVVNAGEWTRDSAAGDESTVSQVKVFVQQGIVNRLTFWQLSPTRSPIVVDAKIGTPLRFMRTNAVSTAVVAAVFAPVSLSPAAYPAPNFLKVGVTQLQINRGDRVLLAAQPDPTQRGIYYLDNSDTLLRAPEFGGVGALDLIEKFSVQAMLGDNPKRYYALSNPPVIAGGQRLFVERQSPGLPSISCAIDDPEVSHLRLIGNYFHGDRSDQGSTIGCGGILWLKSGRTLVATGNTLLNYRQKGIQTGSGQTTIVGNNFRTNKYSDSDTIAIETAPLDTSGEEFSVEITGNSCEGSGFLSSGVLSDYATSQKPIDYNVSGNRILGVPVAAASAMNLIRGRRVLIHNNVIDQCTSTMIVVAANVRVIGIYPAKVDAIDDHGLLDIGNNLLVKDGDRVFLAPYLNQPGATDAGTLPAKIDSAQVYFVKRLANSSTQIQIYRDSTLRDRLSSFVTTGTQRHVLMYGNWDCILSIVGNTVLRPIANVRYESILVGNKDPFWFPTGVSSDTYAVPAGAGFFGHTMIGNNFLASGDSHVVGKRPFAITRVPLILFNNRGFDSGSNRKAIGLRLVENDSGLGGFDFQGPDEDVEVLAL